MNFARLAAGAAALALLSGAPLRAQLGGEGSRAPVQSAADLAIAQGRLDDAEQLLFAASSRRPRDPAARGALGEFLASRGHLKVGAVLLEEARQFGGDATVINARLARIYAWLGDWRAVAALRGDTAKGAEPDRARWLASHAPVHSGADSVKVALEPNDAAGLGRIQITIGRASVQADIDPRIDGMVLPATAEIAAGVQQFGMRDSSSVAVVFDVRIGGIRLANVAARLAPGAHAAIGLDVLAALTPTFDAAAHLLTLRQRAPSPSGEPLPILLAFPGVKIVARAGQAPAALESAAGRAALRGTRWTFDLRRGAIFTQP